MKHAINSKEANLALSLSFSTSSIRGKLLTAASLIDLKRKLLAWNEPGHLEELLVVTLYFVIMASVLLLSGQSEISN